MNTPFKTLILLFGLTSSITFAQPTQTPQPKAETKFPDANAFENSNLTYKLTNSPNKTFGYDIFADNRLLIRQPSIPGLSGNEGFKSSQSAEKVAKLVITKIKKGEMPPTVSMEEMKKLNVINK